MRYIGYLILALATLMPLAACEDEESGNGTKINHKYDLILGFLVPDEDRLSPTEVFVGYLKPFNPGSYLVAVAEDSFLREQIFEYVDVYRADAIGYEDAEISISSETQTINLENVGSGIYRDVRNELRVSTGATYSLRIERPKDLVYTDQVTVPGDVLITNISANDTVIVYPQKPDPSQIICHQNYPVIVNKPTNAYLFEARQSNNGAGIDPSYVAKYMSFDPSVFGAPAIYYSDAEEDDFVNFNFSVIAMDSTAAIAYNPFGTFAGNDAEAQHLDFWRFFKNIHLRNGVQINKNRRVIGNFGAYNTFQLRFTAMAKRDSCG
ncbi:MAG: hypothetical protein RJQ09_04115 [Cyclobacteriaceae bacterium]